MRHIHAPRADAAWRDVLHGRLAIGHEALSFRARCIAALLAVGDDAALSYETAAHLWIILPTQPPFIDVTTTGRRPRTREGLTIHSAASRMRRDGLLLTTPEQTLHARSSRSRRS